MKALNIPVGSDKVSSAYIFVFRYIAGSFILFTLAFMLLKFPALSAEGVKKGMSICAESLVPSLYPFMIVSNVFVSSKAADIRLPFLDKICRYLFHLPASALPVIIFSFIGGLPIGAKMACGLYEAGKLSKKQCAGMICFCVNPGPAFVISAVGSAMLGSGKAGLIIYASLVLSSIIMGIASGFLSSYEETEYLDATKKEKPLHNVSLIENAVTVSSKAIIGVCSWVVAFSCLSELISALPLGEGVRSFLLCVAEMTRGCATAAENYPLPITAAVIGFSGICGHLQLMGEMRAGGLKYKHFLVGRIINSGLAAAICGFLLKLFPVASQTFSVGTRPQTAATSGSAFLSVLMLIMAVIFVLGDDFKVVRKKV